MFLHEYQSIDRSLFGERQLYSRMIGLLTRVNGEDVRVFAVATVERLGSITEVNQIRGHLAR